jgi:PAS domain S-box-containing protein
MAEAHEPDGPPRSPSLAGGDTDALLRLLLENAPAAIALLDADLRYLAVSRRWIHDYGLEGRDLVGRSHYEVCPEIPQAWRDVHRRALAGETLRAERERFVRADGTVQWQKWEVLPWRRSDGRIGGLLILTEDVGERVHAEQALRESESKYRGLFESIDEGFCIFEMLVDESGRPVDYRFLEVNPAFERHTGLAAAQGKRMRELAPAHEDHWFEIYGHVARTGEPIRFEQRAEQLGRWYDVYAWRIGPPEHRQVAALFDDVTARKQAEHALAEVDRRKDEFLATLAHELRNPLAPIRNALAILRLHGPEPPAARSAREMIERQVAHMVRLIEDLLDVSRISRGKLELRKERVDLAAVVAQALETALPHVEAGGHELAVDLPQARVELDADPVRLSQVLSNLLHNAAKYTGRGGHIRLSAETGDGEVRLRVADDGIGIAPDQADEVFELFHQVGTTRERSQGGLGIGLSLVKALVELHGGDVSVRSPGAGLGSEFVVRLPLAPGDSAAPNGSPPAERAPSGDRRRVLVVDDNKDSVESLATVLGLHGHRVESAHDGFEALEAAERFRPDAVLLDLGMPGIDGYETCRRLRATPWGRRALVVAQTGWNSAEDRERTRAAGFDGHMVKPIDIGELERVLEKAPRGEPEKREPR